MISPLEQFRVRHVAEIVLGGLDVSLTNSSVMMIITTVSVCVIFSLLTLKRDVVPHSAQVLSESVYFFIKNLIQDTIGEDGFKYIPFMMSLFLFIFIGNLLSLFPYSFGWTAHLSTVGALSLLNLAYSAVAGMKTRGLEWFRTFLPKGIPWAVAPLIVPIEMLSFLAKPFSLTIRLVMNMMVGHIMIALLTGFIGLLGALGVIPLAFSGILIVFESGISFLQAYIYTILSCIYLGESIHSH